MKILHSHRYYWPDTAPYAFLLHAIAEDLANEGHDIHVYCSKPSYRKNTVERRPAKEQLGLVNVYRCFVFQEEGALGIVRAINVFLYMWGLFFRILLLRPDVVTAATFPPIFAGYMASFGAKIVGARFIYHMQDIHPEVSEISGGLMGKRGFSKIFKWIDNQTLKRSSAIVVLSNDMANTLRERQLGELPIRVINNFAFGDDGLLESPLEQYAKPNGVRRVLFAGNLGRFQNLPVLTEGIVTCLNKHEDIQLFFLGDGKVCDELKSKWEQHPQITFAPFLPIEQARPLIAEADIGLVSLSEDIYKVAYPSKILTYLALGVPVFALTDNNSALARELSAAGVAAVPETACPEHIAKTLIELLDSEISRERIMDWYTSTFSRSVSMGKWCEILDVKDDSGGV